MSSFTTERRTLTVSEAAPMLGVNPATVHRWIVAGKLVGHKVNPSKKHSTYVLDEASVRAAVPESTDGLVPLPELAEQLGITTRKLRHYMTLAGVEPAVTRPARQGYPDIYFDAAGAEAISARYLGRRITSRRTR